MFGLQRLQHSGPTPPALHCAALQVAELAAYALPLLRPGVDCAVLPADPGTREFASWVQEVLAVQPDQVSTWPGHKPAPDAAGDRPCRVLACAPSAAHY